MLAETNSILLLGRRSLGRERGPRSSLTTTTLLGEYYAADTRNIHEESFIMSQTVWQGCTPRPGLPWPPRKKEALPRPALWKLPKPVGRSGAKLISIHWNSEGNYKGRIQFCPIIICLTHKSVDFRAFLPRLAPWIFPLPCPTCPQTITFTPPRPALWPKSSAPCIPGENALPVTVWVKRCQFLVLVLRRPNRHLF